MSTLTFDFETTTYNKGNPFDVRNKAVCVAYKWAGQEPECIFLDNEGAILELQQLFERATYLIGFNLKFDIHWARKLGCNVQGKRVFDGQYAEFILKNQTTPYPSLEDCASTYLDEHKEDEVAKFWEQGIQTDEIPRDILASYAKQDVVLTEKLAKYFQKKLTETNKMKLFLLHMEDLFVLEDMEYNGLKYDEEQSISLGRQTDEEIKDIDKQLFSNHIYGEFIKPTSGDWLSAFLYGGVVVHEQSIPNGVWKTGKRAGTVRYKHVEYPLKFERQFEPPKGSELKKEGFYATDEKTLRKLKGNKEKRSIIQAILKRSELEKLSGTYYKGLPALIEKMNWPKDMLHGQLNQIVARTGRLSSSSPNIQNFSGDIKHLFYSRY